MSYLFMSEPEEMMWRHASIFTTHFLSWLPDNLDIYYAFEAEAFKVMSKGFTHYSARTIVHYMRHYTALSDTSSTFKIINGVSPYLARVFALVHPKSAGLFQYNKTPAVVDLFGEVHG